MMSDLLAGFTNGEGEWLQVLTNLVNWKNKRKGSRFLGGATLCGRLEEALRSDTYGDFREGQPTLVNIVAVSG